MNFQVLVSGLLDGNSSGWEQARDVATDDLGNIYIVGGTTAADFPTTEGDPFSTGGGALGSQGETDAFITKLDSFGNIIWSRFLGGPNYDRAYAVEVDENYNVYIAGRAGPGFPTTPGVVQEDFGGDVSPNGAYGKQDGFVAKLSPDGATVLWATYFGDSGPGIIRDMDIDVNGIIHIAAFASASEMDDYVTGNAIQKTRNGTFDSFYARLSNDGSTVLYGTWLGGDDNGSYYSANPAVRALSDGSAYFLTIDPADGVDITPGARPYSGGMDLVVAKFAADGSLDFCTYLGGSGDEEMDTHSLAVNPNGDAVVGANTNSSDYPVTDSSGLSAPGSLDVPVTVLSPTGQILHSTIVGGASSYDGAEGVSTDSQGNIYLSGFTNSDDLPVTQYPIMPWNSGREGLLAVYSPDLSELKYLSYDGLLGEYVNRSSTIDAFGRWVVVGSVWHLNPYPATVGQDGHIDGTHAAHFQIYDIAAPNPAPLPATFSSGALKVVVIGASTAACKNLVEGGYAMEDCWTERLKSYLQSSRPGSSVVNLAVSGTGTCHGLPTGATVPNECPSSDAHAIPLTANNITQALSLNPDVVIVNYPHDYGIGVDATIDNLKAIQAAATTANVPIWFTTSQPAFADLASVDKRIDQRNQVQSTFVERAIDFWNPLVDPQGDGTMSSAVVNHYDDVHPNDEGHRRLFESVKRYMGL